MNHSPSFSTVEYVDRQVKSGLVRDTFNLLGINGTDRKNVLMDDQTRVKKRLTKLINQNKKEKESAKHRRYRDYANDLKATREYYDKKQAEWEVHLKNYKF